MSARVLVAGIGNIFFGDDGFGPEAVARLAADDRGVPEGVEVIDYGIRGMHLAYDLLEGYDALVVVDAVPRGAAPGAISVLEVGSDDLGHGDFDAHGMNPVAVLGSVANLGGTLPRTYIVGCRPATMEEHLGLSPAVEGAVPAAVDLIQALLLNTVLPAVAEVSRIC